MSSLPLLTSQRNLLIAGGVVLLHVGALWALNTGLLRPAVEIVVPVEAISELLTPAPPPAPPPPSRQVPPRALVPPPQARAPAPTPAPEKPAPTLPAPELRAAAPTPAPGPQAPLAPPAPPTPPATATLAPLAVAPAPAPRIELPSSDADYLQNPRPAYPPASRRLGEQGKVVVRVLIGVDGSAQRAEIRQSSGFERLDQAALQTVLRWRYVPGKREGAPEAMWFNVPINFVLE